MLVTRLQWKFAGSDRLVTDAVERARQANDRSFGAIVNVLMTALLLGAIGSFVRAIVIMIG